MECKGKVQGKTLDIWIYKCVSNYLDRYKKCLKASYSQTNNKYKDTVVGSYQMILYAMRIYQARNWKPKE